MSLPALVLLECISPAGHSGANTMPPLMRDALAVLLAGGQGERLWPLTRDRAKPAVPFGGVYRIIDVTLSNCLNSDLRRVFVLTQYKAPIGAPLALASRPCQACRSFRRRVSHH